MVRPYQENPIIFLAFANEPSGVRGHRRNLGEEAHRLEESLTRIKAHQLRDLIIKSYPTLDQILQVLRENRKRVANFHYGGHADYDQRCLRRSAGHQSVGGEGHRHRSRHPLRAARPTATLI